MVTDVENDSQSIDHFKLLCDFGELNWIFPDTGDIDTFLHRIVTMVARHSEASACTVFLYDRETDKLDLRAAVGLGEDLVGKLQLDVGEGLTGLSLKENKPFCVLNPTEHPQFRLVPGIDEEKYGSFLAVPITRGISKIGVLTLHKDKGSDFSEKDVMTLSVISSQLANIIENASLLLQLSATGKHILHHKAEPVEEHGIYKGESATDGFAMGKAFILDRAKSFSQLLEAEFKDSYTLEDFKGALSETEKQLYALQGDVEEKLDDAASLIFTSHLLMLKDPVFIEQIITRVKKGEAPPEALLAVSKQYIDIFSNSTNPIVREKVLDVEDLTLRILGNLDKSTGEYSSVKGKIVIVKDLYPSDILLLSSEKAGGVVQVSGGVTSHVAILARSLQLPMVILDRPQLLSMAPGTMVLLDADIGNIYVNPHPDAIKSFKNRMSAYRHVEKLKPDVKPETYTKDGTRVRLQANINLYSDLKLAMELNAEGAGLYRTEFPFLIRKDFPTEEEQYFIYKRLIDISEGKEITFRTLDIGGDKIFSYYENYREANPFLGMRSIRFSLANRDIFIQQIRAILKACADTTIKIMFPMISSVDQFLEAREILFQCRDDLLSEGVSFKKEPCVGMMVEVPSLVEIMEDLAKVADFFSIGTNDLIQYILGVDRTNQKVANLYLPHHPSVLRSLKRIVDAANKNGKEVSICGAMAHQRRYLPFLLGIGLRIFSMNAIYISRIQKQILAMDIGEAEDLAAEILKRGSISEIEALLP